MLFLCRLAVELLLLPGQIDHLLQLLFAQALEQLLKATDLRPLFIIGYFLKFFDFGAVKSGCRGTFSKWIKFNPIAFAFKRSTVVSGASKVVVKIHF